MSDSATISSTRVLWLSRKVCKASAHIVYSPPPSTSMSFSALLLVENSFPLAFFLGGCGFNMCGAWWRMMEPSSLGLCLVRSLAWDANLWSAVGSSQAAAKASLLGFLFLCFWALLLGWAYV
ncbi:hypothetical protein C1H46_009230 [Malus baccata]|uniref:Uncharacterized protein n=1 Tax=Malus baccata TaxID=106549 RepID=A0A540N1Y5_MALBA|nr:hypothetical protein C1H46_009230 [Malus baccata]